MLNISFRPAASPARVRLFGLAVVWVGACSVWLPAAQAAETAVSEPPRSSPFEQYQGWRDEPLQDWREANTRVGEIGGWRTYLREAQQGGETAADPAGQGSAGGHLHHGH